MQIIDAPQRVLIFLWGFRFLFLDFEFLLPFGTGIAFWGFGWLLDLDEGLFHFVELLGNFFALLFFFKNEQLVSEGFDSLLAFHETYLNLFEFVVFLIDLAVEFIDFLQ